MYGEEGLGARAATAQFSWPGKVVEIGAENWIDTLTF